MFCRLLIFSALCVMATSASAFTLNIVTNNVVADQSFRVLSALPSDGQVMSASPETISITFSQPLHNEKSVIKVLDMYGSRVDSGETSMNDMKLSVPVQELAPGKYTVKWSAHCRCSEDTTLNDSFHFTVR